MFRLVLVLSLCLALASIPTAAQRRPLASTDVDDIGVLLKLEDTRLFDEAALGRLLKSAHPEVRRRAAVSIGRINDQRGAALLERARGDEDVEVAASVVFATGQLAVAGAVEWLGGLLTSARTSPIVAREAAQALGKIRTPEAHQALSRYLTTVQPSAAAARVVGEALLSMGRFTTKAEIAPIVRWASDPNVEVRWRAAWALFRPRNPDALPHLMKLMEDASGDVRFWAVRGPTPATVDAAGMDRATASERLRAVFQRDSDRRVRTEALRALLQYDNETAFGALVNALYSPDTWLSVSAAEAAGRFTVRAGVLAPLLVDVSEPSRPMALRITALSALVTLAPDAKATVDLAASLARTDVTAARNAGFQALGRLGDLGRTRLDELAADPAMAGRLPQTGTGRGGGGTRRADTPRTARPDTEYRQLVERWIVPDYNGAPKPRAIWETPRGAIELELNPGDAPFGVEHFLRLVQTGDIVGTEFTRLVPDFVAQQQPIRNASTLRDEVNRHGLTRGNLSWASAGLDTGRPGYTLGHTPQPHNEGGFTALGRVVQGMDVVDRLELGDKVTGAKVVTK